MKECVLDQPATEQQKNLIADIADRGGEPIDRHGRWPEPFTKRDAYQMINELSEEVAKRRIQGMAGGAP
jgi:hypothetical protein